jgi:UDP-N-acetylglucosamine--N-acetylmuramyl-(pentapeptide) pyrophosphoryl-undecaprenol N-acetylglucosamine transferase
MREALPMLVERLPKLQFVHLTGTTGLPEMQEVYQRLGVKALVQGFSSAMHQVLGAATLAVSRAGGSSLAELAATGTPAVLIPFPEATDQHQRHNAAALERLRAAVVLDQNSISGGTFAAALLELLAQPARRAEMRENISSWQPTRAAARIVDAMFAGQSLSRRTLPGTGRKRHPGQSRPATALNPFSFAAP